MVSYSQAVAEEETETEVPVVAAVPAVRDPATAAAIEYSLSIATLTIYCLAVI